MPAGLARQVTIVVLEQKPWWSPQLQHLLLDRDARVRTATSPKRVEEHLESAGSAVIVLSPDDNLIDSLNALEQLARRAPVIVVASERTRELECPYRELGATAFITRQIRAEELLRICLRHLPAGVDVS